MKSQVLFMKMLFLSCLLLALGFTVGGCSDDDDKELQAGYGYAQFRLFKSGAYPAADGTRAGTNELDYLRDAHKMKIILLNNQDGGEITQTVGLYPMGSDSEEGLRSEKMQLMAGSYTVVGFYIYKVKGQDLEVILSGEPMEKTVVNVLNGGLAVQDIAIKVVERGNVKFTLKKNMVDNTRGAGSADNYVFSDVSYATLYVVNEFTKERTTFTNIPFKYTEKTSDGKLYAIAESDSLLSLRAGTYTVASYTLLDKKKKTLDGDNVLVESKFEVEDNQTTEADVAVNLYHSAQYIQDYIALRQIWEALDGENWSYSGLNYPKGANWDFDKDIDLWGEQPGVDTDGKGRVIVLNIGSFGPRGSVPAAIGQLTELKILTLGTHSDVVGDNMLEQWKGGEATPEQKEAWRKDYYDKFLKKDLNSTLSPLLQLSLRMQAGEERPVWNPEIKTRATVTTRDVLPGDLTNGITGVSKEIGKLTKLQQLFIANGKFSDFEKGTDFSALEDLKDVEIYNCPLMKALPEALFTMPNVELLNLANNPQIESSVFEEGLDRLAKAPGAPKLQMLYLGSNSLTTLPESFRRLKKLGLLDCTHNQITKIPAFGKDVNLVQLMMDYNQIEEIPNIDGYFCGYEDVESFSFAHNKIREFPNIFNAESVFVMSSVDFSFNEISGFEDGENFRGVNAKTLSLAGNRLTTFPGILFKKNSNISILLLSGNGIEEFPEGSLEGTETYNLQTLDLTYNKLSKLPKDLNAVTLPYLYGMDMSNNRFSKFPTQPLNIDHLSAFGLSNQRDEKGNRTLREWPTGIYQCPSLRALMLGGNDLRKIEDTISPNIFIFEIIDNPNISIDLSAVCPYIQAGYYQLIYDPTQDIRGCDALNLE